MPSFLENIETKKTQWANVSRTFIELETAYNDLVSMIDSMKPALVAEAKKSDEFLKVKNSFDTLNESYQELKSASVAIDNTDDWDALQEYFTKYNKARENHEKAMSTFLEG